MMFKEIHIGKLIEQKVKEENIDISRIVKFFNLSEDQIQKMYIESDISTSLLLKWSKILEYDFFRLYCHHLILYSPPKGTEKKTESPSKLPAFRKNLYTEEIIKFILEMIHTNQKTKLEIMNEYKIPRTTLYKWTKKYEK